MIELDDYCKNSFLQNLNYQIGEKYYRFYRKAPVFLQTLDDLSFQLDLKNSIHKIRKNFEENQMRKNYNSLMKEFKTILKRK